MKHRIIIQSNSLDRSTDDVISWMNYFQVLDSVIVFWDNYEIHKFNTKIEKASIEMSINDIVISSYDTFWYRRGKFVTKTYLLSRYENVNYYLQHSQIKSLDDLLTGKIFNRQLNCFNDNYIEKIKMLCDCQCIGLRFPDSIFTDTLEDVEQFMNKHNSIIVKSTIVPFGSICAKNEKCSFSSGTVKIAAHDLENKPEHFLPSLFQEYLPKKYEIRTFFIDGNFYSMAMFSQLDKSTAIDCREGDPANPIRKVPFNLPKEYEEKLQLLIKKYGLNSCSIDTIVTPDNDYYFLEINPIGQFQWLSRSCNYFLEKQIALFLIKN